MTELRFIGDLTWWQGLLLAGAAGYLAWRVYRRELRIERRRQLVWQLPLLRAAAVAMIVLMLAGPVLHHREVIGQLGRVFVFIDGSQSMSLTDEHMPVGRKLVTAQRKGWLAAGTVDTAVVDAADALAEAKRTAIHGGRSTTAASQTIDAARRFAAQLEQTAATIANLKPQQLPAPPPTMGSITFERWDGLGGTELSGDVRQRMATTPPSRRGSAEFFESAQNAGENYAARLRGHVHPPVSGMYAFWLSSDDHSELRLSSDESESNARVIARNQTVSGYRQWHDQGKSEPIALTAGKRYYIEALLKEGNGEDYVSVGWSLPGGGLERPIPGSRLSPYEEGDPTGGSFDMLARRFSDDLLKPARALGGAADAEATRTELRRLAGVAGDFEQRFRDAFERYAQTLIESNNRDLQTAVMKFDAMPRWQRAESILLEGDQGLLARLAETHHVELVALKQDQPQRLWRGEGGVEPPATLGAEADATATNLSDGVKARLDDDQQNAERLAVVLLSDGQHNAGSSPIQTAKVLGYRGIPMLTVSLGSSQSPADLAVLGVEGPQSVFAEDRVRGRIRLKDDMPPGKPFMLRIEHEGTTLWEKPMVTENRGVREVEYDFAVKPLVDQQVGAAGNEVTILSLPLAMRVGIEPISGEVKQDNNQAYLPVRAITQGRRVLVLDGRPRWEFRYIRNLFDRDKQWETSSLVATAGSGSGDLADRWPRGDGPDMFPRDREGLFRFDLIVFGELRPGLLTTQELEWLGDFVEKRGGGLMFIDGKRGYLSQYADTPIGPLIPVERLPGSMDAVQIAGARPDRLQLTEAGAKLASLSMLPGDGENRQLWRVLPAPHWVAPVRVLPGVETLAEATIAESKMPVLALRRFGAGRVLYSATDETWRWRYEVADRYHARYWNQIATWIMEQPYAVSDQFVSLDVGSISYAPGEAAKLRVRLRDEQGRPIVHATVQAELRRDGQKIATAILQADENLGGVFRGETDPLAEPGQYDVSVKVTGFTERQMRATTSFIVQPRTEGELAELRADEQLLREMATDSGGQYLREEDAGQLAERLAPLSQGRVVESETALWQSYWWFVPIMLLFTCEWLVRKRAGML